MGRDIKGNEFQWPLCVPLTIHLEPQVMEDLDRAAAQTGSTPAEFAALAITNHLTNRELFMQRIATPRPGEPATWLDEVDRVLQLERSLSRKGVQGSVIRDHSFARRG